MTEHLQATPIFLEHCTSLVSIRRTQFHIPVFGSLSSTPLRVQTSCSPTSLKAYPKSSGQQKEEMEHVMETRSLHLTDSAFTEARDAASMTGGLVNILKEHEDAYEEFKFSSTLERNCGR